ncbi:MAG: LPS export ABC transporter permease LptG [Porticoccaceae bacterium]
MRLLPRYIGRQVFGAILLVLLILVAIDAIAAIVDGVGDIRNQYKFADVIYETLLRMPARIYRNLPYAALIGCLVGLGVLAGHSELVVMRTAGVSLLRITGAVAAPVLALIVAGALLGEYLVPPADQWAASRRMLLRGEQEVFSGGGGLWNREGSEFMHFNAVNPEGLLVGVARYRFGPDRQIEEASFSARARFLGDHWREEEGAITRFTASGTETATFAEREWRTDLSPNLLMLVMMPADALSMRNLYGYAAYLEGQGQKSGEHWLAFWAKALQPLVIVSLVLIAVSFVFGPLREATMGFRIFSGVGVGIVFQISMRLLGPASLVFGFSPFWAVMAPVIACALIGLVLLRRVA